LSNVSCILSAIILKPEDK